MAITVSQDWEGSKITGQLDDGSINSRYIIFGTDDEFDAWAALNAATAGVVGSLTKQDVNIDGRIGSLEWAGSVKWGLRERPSTNDSYFSFDTGGGQQHITQSLETVESTSGAPDFKGAIGVAGDNIEGVDVTVPVYTFEERHYLDSTGIDAAYKAVVFALTGKMNSASFKGFAAGEVLFLGAQGSLRTGEQWEVIYRFAASENQTDIDIGDLQISSKFGHDYLWVLYSDELDSSANRRVQRPKAAYVERVYQPADLNLLGI